MLWISIKNWLRVTKKKGKNNNFKSRDFGLFSIGKYLSHSYTGMLCYHHKQWKNTIPLQESAIIFYLKLWIFFFPDNFVNLSDLMRKLFWLEFQPSIIYPSSTG